MRSLRTLQCKVAVVLALLLVVSFGALIGLESTAERGNALQRANESSRSETALIATRLSDAIAARDGTGIEDGYFDVVYQQRFEQRRPVIAGLRAYASNGVPLRRYDTIDAPRLPESLAARLARAAIAANAPRDGRIGRLMIHAVPVDITVQEEPVGALVVGWDSTNVVEAVHSRTRLHILIGSFAGLLTLLGVLLAVRAMVMHPLAKLAGLVAHVRRSGELKPICDDSLLAHEDEIGALTNDFNLMLAELAQARLELIQASEAALSARSEQLDAALNGMSHGLCMFDGDGRLIVSNPRFREMYGVAEGDIPAGTTYQEMADRVRPLWNPVGRSADDLLLERKVLAEHGEAATMLDQLNDGRTIAVSLAPMAKGGWVAIYEDVTERKQAEARIAYLAHHDPLTGLPNRLLFREELARATGRIGRGEKLAVLCLDLDHFKSVNDSIGHPIGDQLLRAVAARLRGCMRDHDCLARQGGDEFAVIQIGIEHADQTRALAEHIIETLGAPYEIDGHQVVIGASVGIAIAPVDGHEPDQLLKCADLALCRAKAEGRGAYRFFESDMDARMQTRRALELDLREVVQGGGFALHYQPVVSLATDSLTGFEALLRWNHAERGDVPPSDFIPLAEEIGLIRTIGAWVLQQACHEAAGWPEELTVAVNLSPAQFRSRSLLGDVTQALAASRLAPNRLELEITETVMLHDTDATMKTLHQLRALGVRIAMDDFGTGYSSLSYLRQFPFDRIKIDRSFIGDLLERADSAAIVKAVVSLGASLGMAVTAEGVETEGQLASLRREGCTDVQGFLLGKAWPPERVRAFIAGDRRLVPVAKAEPAHIEIEPLPERRRRRA